MTLAEIELAIALWLGWFEVVRWWANHDDASTRYYIASTAHDAGVESEQTASPDQISCSLFRRGLS
jgi:hypothetical protein